MFQFFFDDYRSSLIETDEINQVEKQFPANLALVGLLLSLVLVYSGVQVLAVILGRDMHGISTLLLLVLLVVCVIAVARVDEQGRRMKEESVWKHKARIEILKKLLSEKEYGLNRKAGVDWLIQECGERLSNSSIGSHHRSMLNRSFDRIVYPIIAFLCGQISNYLTFSRFLGDATTIVATISLAVLILVMLFPIILDLMNRDFYALDILLDDLLYLKGSEDYNNS